MGSGAPIVLIMGPPGAGKGTQAAHIVEQYGLEHLATGDVLRNAVAAGTPLGLEAKTFMEAGKLVPDEVTIGLLRDLMSKLPEGRGVLLDGFPRTLPQAEALTETIAGLGRKVDAVLDVQVPRQILIERLSSRWICRSCQRPYNVVTNPPQVAGVCDACKGELYQRADDVPEAVAKRLDVYVEQTAPVSAYYRDLGVYSEIDGNRSFADVQAAIDATLGALSS